MGIIEYRRRIILGENNSGKIPKDYQEVEFIKSGNADAYIITDCITDNVAGARWKCSFTDNIPSGEKCVFGWLGSGSEQGFYADFYGSKFYGAVLNSRYRNKISITHDVDYDCYMDAFTLNIGNYSQAPEYTGIWNAPQKLGIFCTNKNDEPFWIASNMKLYYLKIYSGNTLIADFVPCYRKSDGEIGVYEVKSGKFYGNVGTGTFTKGNEI